MYAHLSKQDTAESLAQNFLPAVESFLRKETPRGRNKLNNVNHNNGIDIISEEWLKVYPNPTSDFVNFEYPLSQKGVQIGLYDVTGRKIVEVVCPDGTGKLTMDMSKFDRGGYSFRLIGSNGINKAGKIILD